MPNPPLETPAVMPPGHFRRGGGRGVFQQRARFFATGAGANLACGGSHQHSRTELKGRPPVHVRHINCTRSRHGARYGHEHCDPAHDLGLPLEPDRSLASRRRGTAAGDALGVRETSRNSARCDRTRVRVVRVLGSERSRRPGLESMTPRREDRATAHQ